MPGPVDISRAREMSAARLHKSEHNRAIGRAFGMYIDMTDLGAFNSANRAGVREACILLPERILIAGPKRGGAGIKSLFKALRGNQQAAFREASAGVELPRSSVTTMEISHTPPHEWRLTGATFLHIRSADQTTTFWIDPGNTDIAKFVNQCREYFPDVKVAL